MDLQDFSANGPQWGGHNGTLSELHTCIKQEITFKTDFLGPQKLDPS